LLHLLPTGPFTGAPEDLLATGFDPPGDHPAAGPAHQLEHLGIDKVHSTVAGPPEPQALLEDPLAQPNYLLPTYREQVGVHVNVANTEADQ
jgi:hypothetical protein